MEFARNAKNQDDQTMPTRAARPSVPPVPPQHEFRFLALLLLTLHLALWPELPDWLARVLLLAHFGLFWLWYPLWGTREPIALRHLALSLALVAGLVVVLDAWLLTAWKIVLLGLLGGRELYRRRERLAYLAAMLFVLLDVFIIDMDRLFRIGLAASELGGWLHYGLLALPAGLLLVPAGKSLEHRAQMDFFHGFSLSLLTAVVLLSSVVVMYAAGLGYPLAALSAALGTAGMALFVSWLWRVFAGFDDLAQLWARHTVNIGGSFEQWLANLTQPGNYKLLTPEQFLHAGLDQLAALPWVSGISWRSPYGEGVLRRPDKHYMDFSVQSLDVTVYAPHPIQGNHYAQAKLLVQLLEHLHQAKRREEAFAQQAHLKAIHETGAKLTHDIKNLLQSLHAITSAMQTCQQPEKFGETQRLLQGQLPHLSQRLKRTLEKLKQPDQPSYTNIPIRTWWDNLRARYRKREVDFSMSVMWNATIPEELFDNVVENLLENALNKRKREPGLRIHVALTTSEGQIRLTVCDDGSAVPPEIEKHLLTEAVPSRDGFGIGLYQAAKQVIQGGYRLNLSHNMPGQVCFELSSV